MLNSPRPGNSAGLFPIPGFPDYAVTADGRVWSCKRGPWRELTQHRHKQGYKLVTLCNDGRQRKLLVHSLIALVFIGPRPPGLEVDHKDTDNSNNAATNLQYLTPEQNRAKFHALGRKRGPSKLPRRTYTYINVPIV